MLWVACGPDRTGGESLKREARLAPRGDLLAPAASRATLRTMMQLAPSLQDWSNEPIELLNLDVAAACLRPDASKFHERAIYVMPPKEWRQLYPRTSQKNEEATYGLKEAGRPPPPSMTVFRSI